MHGCGNYVKYIVKCFELIIEKQNDDDRENCFCQRADK